MKEKSHKIAVESHYDNIAGDYDLMPGQGLDNN